MRRWACWWVRKRLASVGRTHQCLVPERSTVVLSIVRFQRLTRSLALEDGFGQPVFHAAGAAGADWQRPPVRQQVPPARNHSPPLRPHLPRARHRARLHPAEPTLFLQRPSQAPEPHDCRNQRRGGTVTGRPENSRNTRRPFRWLTPRQTLEYLARPHTAQIRVCPVAEKCR